jgi:hypothetical protein
MDDRQTKITEGAGLEESRLNQELIEWLNKWGYRILMVVLVLAAGWVGKTRWDQHVEKRLDTALIEFEAEVATGSPDGLVALAKKHKNVSSVWQQAMLNAAAINLESGRKALVPGGDPENKDDFLDANTASMRLEAAGELYSEVLDRVGRSSTAINALDARAGRIATLISLQDGAGARTELNELIALLDKIGYVDLKKQAEKRLADLDALIAQKRLPSYGELAVLAEMRGPIAMYAETPEDITAIRERLLSKELIEPKPEEPPADEAPAFELPAAPEPDTNDAVDEGQ